MTFDNQQTDVVGQGIDLSQSTGQTHSATVSPSSDTDQNPIQVLVADDNPTNRLICRGALSKKGFKVREAVDGGAALDEVEHHRPDVILMDVMMPNMDGLECTRRLKSKPTTSNIPVIIVSACTDASDIAAGMEAGADEYLGKPINAIELEIRIRSVVRLFRNQQAALRAVQAEATTKALEAELTERRKMETELRKAKESAEAASRAKSEFLATMSHELRTPLNGIIGMTDLLLRTNLAEHQRRYAIVAKHSGDALLCLINDILDFSKIEAGKVELESVAFDIRDVIETVADIMEAKAKDKGLQLIRAIHPQASIRVVGDSGRIQQVLINLIGNAIKFTETGHVSIRVMVEDETVTSAKFRFIVNDTGIGIPADRINRLFRSFTQLDASTTRRYGGTGLGLAICKQLIELMGGEIGVSSEPDLGSTFWFTLPLELAPESHSNQRATMNDLRCLRALAVDDNPVNREVIHTQLTELNILVETVPDAQTAISVLRESAVRGEPFGIAILDMQMPTTDGIALARAIKSDDSIRETILIMLSSSGVCVAENELANLGFAAWLEKPVTTERLLDTITTAMACATLSPTHSALKNDSSVHFESPPSRSCDAGILLVDDSEIGREVASATLTMLGYHFDVACNGQQAVEAVEKKTYDLILMDCQMPGMDGFEATGIIRKSESDRMTTAESPRRTAIVALTANAIKGDRELCLNAGMDDYLTKPIQVELLSEVLQRYLDGRDPTATEQRLPDDSEKLQVNHQTEFAQQNNIPAAPFRVDSLLERWTGNKEFVTKLVRMFREQAPGLVSELVKCVQCGDTAQSAQAAHGLKGAAAYVSAEDVRLIAADLEIMAKSGDLSNAMDCLQSLQTELARCLAVHEEDIFEPPVKDTPCQECAVALQQPPNAEQPQDEDGTHG